MRRRRNRLLGLQDQRLLRLIHNVRPLCGQYGGGHGRWLTCWTTDARHKEPFEAKRFAELAQVQQQRWTAAQILTFARSSASSLALLLTIFALYVL